MRRSWQVLLAVVAEGGCCRRRRMRRRRAGSRLAVVAGEAVRNAECGIARECARRRRTMMTKWAGL
jgi:hypothetical protein